MRVLAEHVYDLTVARYFAASMNVEFISFDINKSNKDQIVEIINWIEGPKVVLKVDDTDFIDEAVISVPSYFVFNQKEEIWYKGNLNTDDEDFPQILEIKKASDLDSMRLNTENLYIKSEIIDDILIDKLKALNVGIVIGGGKEEEVGIKSFDHLDDLFEKLEE